MNVFGMIRIIIVGISLGFLASAQTIYVDAAGGVVGVASGTVVFVQPNALAVQAPLDIAVLDAPALGYPVAFAAAFAVERTVFTGSQAIINIPFAAVDLRNDYLFMVNVPAPRFNLAGDNHYEVRITRPDGSFFFYTEPVTSASDVLSIRRAHILMAFEQNFPETLQISIQPVDYSLRYQ